MPPMPHPTMILIVPLILNTISAPKTWAPITRAPEIVYAIADDQPHDDLHPGSSAGNLSWLPPTDICSGHFGMANTTDSSVLLLLLISLPDTGDQLVRYPGSKREANRTGPWTSLSLQPGKYGVPQHAMEESVISHLQTSLDVGLFSLVNNSLLSPTIATEERHHVEAPTLHGVVLCGADGNGSFIQSLFQEGRRHTRKISAGYMESASSAQPRKLLGAHGKNCQGYPQALLPKKRALSAVAIAVCSALLALLCTVAGLRLCCRRNMLEDGTHRQRPELCPSGPRRYRHCELATATSGFSEQGKIGRGGFGPVYRGYLRDQDCHVAVKVLSQESSVQGLKEFESEVMVMSRLRHRNIVRLLGWCDGPKDLLLVYEFISNGSLDKHLHNPDRLLIWSERYNIALGVGSAILYLHTECEQCVVHGDIKPANVMLTSSFQAKLGDFGLARLLDHGAELQTTQVVAGTIGYIDPQLVNNRRPSAMADVYSFGVVLLEIACGRRLTSKVVQSNGASVHLLNWVRGMYRQDSILEAADPRLGGEFDEQQLKRLLVTGLWCAQQDQSKRPSIVQAMDVLRREDAKLPVFQCLEMDVADAVRFLEKRAYGNLIGDDYPCEESRAETEYHTSEESTYLLAQE